MKQPWQSYYHKYRKPACIGSLYLIIESLIDLSLPKFMSLVVNEGIKFNRLDLIVHYGVIMIALTFIGAIFAVGRNIKATEVSYGIEVDLSQAIFSKILHLKQSDIDNFDEASLITRASSDVLQIKVFLQSFLRIFFKAPIMGVGSVIMVYTLYPPLALVFLLLLFPITILIYFNVKIGVPRFHQLQLKLEQLNHKIQSTLLGIKVVRSFNRYQYEEERFEQSNAAYSREYKETKQKLAIYFPLINFMLYLAMFIFLLLSSFWIRKTNYQVGYIVAMVAYFQQFFLAIMVTMRVFDRSLKARSSKERLDSVFALQSENSIGEVPTRFEALEFKDADFGYGGALVLKNLNFNIKRGQFTAIIGATAAGKSTIVKLLTKEYDLLNGNIYYNNQDYTTLSAKELRKKIAVVRQNDVIFSSSVADNLRFAKAAASESNLDFVLEQAQAKDFVSELEFNKNTKLGRNGVKLSGGQRQRLALARALLKSPEILILDDSSSSLDNITEAKILHNLIQTSSDLTLIMIAQKIASVKNAEQIIVLDDGEIAAIGKHDELLKSSTLYQSIYASQGGS